MKDSTRAAKYYVEKGWAPIPVRAIDKAPIGKNWQELRFSAETINGQFQNSNIGLILGEASGGLVGKMGTDPYFFHVFYSPKTAPTTLLFLKIHSFLLSRFPRLSHHRGLVRRLLLFKDRHSKPDSLPSIY